MKVETFTTYSFMTPSGEELRVTCDPKTAEWLNERLGERDTESAVRKVMEAHDAAAKKWAKRDRMASYATILQIQSGAVDRAVEEADAARAELERVVRESITSHEQPSRR